MRLSGLAACALLFFTACNKSATPGNHPPQITFISITPEKFKVSDPEATVTIGFEFSDPDGDVGTPNMLNPPPNIYIRYSLDTSAASGAYLPTIDETFNDPEKGIKGTAAVILKNFFSLDSVHQVTGDTCNFEIYIKDQAGNESNRFTTPDIFLEP